MRRISVAKFPNSAQLYKFCFKVLMHQRGGKVNDQEVGAMLDFNPSDCSHWKRGEKNVKSVFALATLSETLGVESTLIHDVASGAVDVDEAYFEYLESRNFAQIVARATDCGIEDLEAARRRVEAFVSQIHAQSEFTTAPLYLPEVMRFFSFISTQAVDIVDNLTRILRVRPGQYCVQFRKGDLKPQTRMSIAKDLGRIIFDAERARFPELGAARPELIPFEILFFLSALLIPKGMMLQEMAKLDARRNIVSELSALFWVPKSVVSFQMQDVVRKGEMLAMSQMNKVQMDQTAL
jgi:hypothetical protein